VADYTAVFLPGQVFTSQASGTIAGGDLLVVSGSGTVAKAAALAGLNYIGVAGHDAVSGQKIAVIAAKAVHESVADGTVTAGDLLTTTNTASRQVKTLAAAGAAYVQAEANASRAVVGIALTTAADNVTVRWMQK
jgi:hypothetical protein